MKEKLSCGDELNVDLTLVFRNSKHNVVELDVGTFINKVLELCQVTLNGILEVSKK